MSMVPTTLPDDGTFTFMHQALGLAAQALFLSNPNPRVGCVITDSNGILLGQGFTQQAGGAHAEVMALRDAQAKGQSMHAATAWVTLEPCAHQGRTGPCCDALAQAGIARVVASLADPNPLVAGQGFARLCAAGVQVQVGPGAVQSRELNIGFFSRMLRGLPWVRMKVAASLDGVSALGNGVSQWITSPQARADGHAWRARACAVLTGSATVVRDNPRLDVREVPTPRQPHLAIVDSRLQTPAHARLFEVPQRQVFVYTLAARQDTPHAHALRRAGANLVFLPPARVDALACAQTDSKPAAEHVDLLALLRDLAQRGINELHVEAGSRLNGALIGAGLVDEVLLYCAPLLLGCGGLGLAAWGPLAALGEGVRLQWQGCERIGPDLRLLARVAGHDVF